MLCGVTTSPCGVRPPPTTPSGGWPPTAGALRSMTWPNDRPRTGGRSGTVSSTAKRAGAAHVSSTPLASDRCSGVESEKCRFRVGAPLHGDAVAAHHDDELPDGQVDGTGRHGVG